MKAVRWVSISSVYGAWVSLFLENVGFEPGVKKRINEK